MSLPEPSKAVLEAQAHFEATLDLFFVRVVTRGNNGSPREMIEPLVYDFVNLMRAIAHEKPDET